MTHGRLHLPSSGGGNPLRWKTPGRKTPVGGKIITDFPPEAVARLRAANGGTAVGKEKEKEQLMNDDKGMDVPHTETPTAVRPQGVVTLAEFEGKSNKEKGAFIREQFPSWLAYQQAKGLSRQEMLALTGMSGSGWCTHLAGYREQPERYGEPKPAEQEPVAEALGDMPAEQGEKVAEAFPFPTMKDFAGSGTVQKSAFIREHFPDWLAYQQEKGLSREEIMVLTDMNASVWWTHQNGYEAHPERYGGRQAEPAHPWRVYKKGGDVQPTAEGAKKQGGKEELAKPPASSESSESSVVSAPVSVPPVDAPPPLGHVAQQAKEALATVKSLRRALAEVQVGDVHPVETLWEGVEENVGKGEDVDTAVDKLREMTELVGELRAAGAVVKVSIHWAMEL